MLIKRSSRELLRSGLPRISCEDRLKSNGNNIAWGAGDYNPSVEYFQWERSTTVGGVLCISTKQGNSGTQVCLYTIGLFKKTKGILGPKIFSARCALS